MKHALHGLGLGCGLGPGLGLGALREEARDDPAYGIHSEMTPRIEMSGRLDRDEVKPPTRAGMQAS